MHNHVSSSATPTFHAHISMLCCPCRKGLRSKCQKQRSHPPRLTRREMIDEVMGRFNFAAGRMVHVQICNANLCTYVCKLVYIYIYIHIQIHMPAQAYNTRGAYFRAATSWDSWEKIHVWFLSETHWLHHFAHIPMWCVYTYVYIYIHIHTFYPNVDVKITKRTEKDQRSSEEENNVDIVASMEYVYI